MNDGEALEKLAKANGIPTATVAPVLSIKLSNASWLRYIIFPTLLILLIWFLREQAADAREVEVRAEYEALAIKDKEIKLADKVAGKELLEAKTKETEIKYVDRVKEVTKYLKEPSADTKATTSCVLAPDFIRVYNDESSSSQ